MNELADLSVKSEETNDILEDISRIITQSKEVKWFIKQSILPY